MSDCFLQISSKMPPGPCKNFTNIYSRKYLFALSTEHQYSLIIPTVTIGVYA